MTARVVANVTPLVRNGGTANLVAGGTMAAAGHVIQGLTGGTGPAQVDFRKMLLLVTSAAAAGTVTIRATGNGNDASGNAQVSPYPSNGVFAEGGQGDVSVAFTAGTTNTVIGPLETDRFLQADGNIYLDWNGGASSTVAVLAAPFNAV